jgi:tetratricopeptide (TPR) repeat protein
MSDGLKKLNGLNRLNELKQRLAPFNNLTFLTLLTFLFAASAGRASTNQPDPVQLFKEGKLDEARPVFEAIARTNSKDAEARSYLGQIELKAGHYDKAVKWFEQAASLSKTNVEHLLWLARAYGRLASQQGAPFGASPARKCKATLEQVLALAPDELRARHGLIEFHLEAPGIVGGSVKEAYRQAEEIRKRDPCEGLIALADLYVRDKKFRDAIQALEKAIEEKPGDLKARYRLGRAHVAAQQYDKAFAIYESILNTATEGRETAYFLIGETAVRSGQRLEQGEAALKRYLELQPGPGMPSHALAYARLGNLYEKVQQLQRAKDSYEQALKLDARNKEASDALRRLAK